MLSSRIRVSSDFVSGFSVCIRLGMFFMAVVLLMANSVWAKPTTEELARGVVENWLSREAVPMGVQLGSRIKEVQTFNDDTGAPAYYVVYLSPSGLVFVPADDLVEPIVGFAGEATSYDLSPANPMGALVSRDIPDRVIHARKVEAKNLAGGVSLTPEDPMAKAREKWNSLAAVDKGPDGSAGSISSVSDVRVAPLIKSTWDQGLNDGSYPDGPSSTGIACYNYNTPPDGYSNYSNYYDGDVYNYVSGCVATATAQIMRYWQYPTAPAAGLKINTYSIKIDGNSYTDYFWGGSGANGAYNWANMPLNPKNGATVSQCKEIGSLCADVGASVNMGYTQGESSTWPAYVAYALVHYFNYSNAISASVGSVYADIDSTTRNNIVNSNLDASFPVLLGIYSTSTNAGHAIVCDGYGYNGGTLYNHLNMGWSGGSNAWYNLPSIGTSDAFNQVGDIIYNIYPTGSGEIISGRVTSNGSTPLSGVSVTAVAGGKTYPALALTSSSGIYAIPYLPSNTAFTVSASQTGHSFTPQAVTTGASITAVSAPSSPGGVPTFNASHQYGNQWGINFVSQSLPATHFSVSAPSSAAPGTAFNFTVTALDTNNQTVTGYSGTVHFTSTDGSATLPANATLTSGTGTFSATLKTVGNQTITATDTSNSSITGTSNTITVSSAQTGSRYMLWSTTGGQVSIWTLDNSNNYLGSMVYGPFSGWSPITFVRRVADGTGRLLWSSTGGAASIWTLDSSNNYLSSKVYGPYSGWTPLTYASNPADGTARLIWAGTGGSVSIWRLDASDNYVSSQVYGPYSGWKPATYVFNTTSGTGRLVWAGTGGSASIWKLDASDNYVSSQVFGPYSGWKPVAYTFNSANGTSILTWASTAGQASIWKFDSSENYLGNYMYGPYSGWSPLTCGFNSADGTPRLIWSGTGGMASIWSLDSSGNYLGSSVSGPFSGWMPIAYW